LEYGINAVSQQYCRGNDGVHMRSCTGPIRHVYRIGKARGLLAEVDGRRFVKTPIKMHATPTAVNAGPADVGQHTRDVLVEAGYAADEIERLVASGAAATQRKEVAQ